MTTRRKEVPATKKPAALNPEPLCGNCKFLWQPKELKKEEIGVCRRYPPTLVDPDGSSRWPMTRVEMTCGEHNFGYSTSKGNA